MHWIDVCLFVCLLQPHSSVGAGDLVQTHRHMSEPPKSPPRYILYVIAPHMGVIAPHMGVIAHMGVIPPHMGVIDN